MGVGAKSISKGQAVGVIKLWVEKRERERKGFFVPGLAPRAALIGGGSACGGRLTVDI